MVLDPLEAPNEQGDVTPVIPLDAHTQDSEQPTNTQSETKPKTPKAKAKPEGEIPEQGANVTGDEPSANGANNEQTAYIIPHDASGDNENNSNISDDELEELQAQSRKKSGPGYYKTLSEEDDPEGIDAPGKDDAWQGFEDAELMQATLAGRIYRRLNGMRDHGDYFVLTGAKNGQLSEKLLEKAILSLVLEKGYSQLHFYRGNKLDSGTAGQALIILNRLKAPGGPLSDEKYRHVEVSYARMPHLEPWNSKFAPIALPFMPHSVNDAINKPLDWLVSPLRAPLKEKLHGYNTWKERRKLTNSGDETFNRTRRYGRSLVDRQGNTLKSKLDEKSDELGLDRKRMTSSRRWLPWNMGRNMRDLYAITFGRSATKAMEKAAQQEQINQAAKQWTAQNRPEQFQREQQRQAQQQQQQQQQQQAKAKTAPETENTASHKETPKQDVPTQDTPKQETHGGMPDVNTSATATSVAPDDGDLKFGHGKLSGNFEETAGSGDTGDTGSSSSSGGGVAPDPTEGFNEGASTKAEQKADKKGEKSEKSPEKEYKEFDPEDGLASEAKGAFDGSEHSAVDAPEKATEIDKPIEQKDRGNNTSIVHSHKP